MDDEMHSLSNLGFRRYRTLCNLLFYLHKEILNQRFYPCLSLYKAICCRKVFQFSINPVEFCGLL